ncbi:unnamed protein product [Pedinophyceae sp. YPF-701]|nr:unnamed protein product [Pedinophyceae sp. YPF-701]
MNAHTARRPSGRVCGFWEKLQRELDFNNWAPRSSRQWRLRQLPSEAESAARQDDANEMYSELKKREDEVRASGEWDEALSSANAAAEEPQVARSFEDADDSLISSSLNEAIAATTGASLDDAEMQTDPLSAEELVSLVKAKYGRTYDLSFARRDAPWGKTYVVLNVMWVHLEQRSFPMSEKRFMEKMDSIATLLNALEQQGHVRAVLQEEAKPRSGMPARPVVGTAVSIYLDLPDQQVAEFFGQGAQ